MAVKRKVPKLALEKILKDNSPQKKKYDPIKQAEGLKTRLDASGVNSEKALDKRNFLEKALNLTPDQNLLFDIFEVIERPQRALFGAIDAVQKGQDVGKAALDGLTRKDGKAVQFKEILHNAGMVNSKEKFGFDDVLGFTGEVFLDPLDLALIPVTGGGSVAAKAAKSLTKADNALDVARTAGKVADIAKAEGLVKVAKEGVEAASKSKRMVSPIDLAFNGVKKGIGKTFKVADSGITAVLKKLDKIDVNKLDELKKLGANIDDIRKPLEMAASYKNFKQRITSMFDVVKSLPSDVFNRAIKVRGSENLTKAKLGTLKNDVITKIDNSVDELGHLGYKNADEIAVDLQGAIELNYKPKATIREMFENTDQAFNEEFATKLRPIMDNLGYKFDDIYEKKILDNGVEAYVLKDDELRQQFVKRLDSEQVVKKETAKVETNDLQGLYNEVETPRFYSQDELDKYARLLQDPKFKELYDYTNGVNDLMLKTIDDVFSGIGGSTTKFREATPDGYTRHTLTQDYKDIPEGMKEFAKEFKGSALQGNINTFTGRAYKMSAQEANNIAKAQIDTLINSGTLSKSATDFWKDKANVNMFETSLKSSIDDFVAEAPKFAKHTKMLDEVLANGFLQDKNLIKGLGANEKIPSGYRKISYTDLHNKFKSISNYLENPEIMEQALKNLPNEANLLIDENVFEMVGRLGDPKELNKFVKFLDATNTLFKKTSLLSPGFQMRNMMGNATNMYLSGVPVNKIFSNYRKADNIMKKGDELLSKVARGDILTKADNEIYSVYEEFIRNGFHEVADELWEIPDDIAKKVGKDKQGILKNIQKFNTDMNKNADARFRLGLLLYARENPEIYRKVGLDNPSDFVRRVLFDPNDLSVAEKTIAKRMIPFYTFAKKNLVFQMQNLMDNPTRYKRLVKAVKSLWSSQDIDMNDLESYKAGNLWLPIPGLTKGGKYVAIKSNLPVGDLNEFMENPLGRVVSSFSPLIRTPFELVSNTQLFTGMPIEEFKGQKGYIMPEISRKQEYLLNQTGLGVPTSFGLDIARTAKQGMSGELGGKSVVDVLSGAVGRSLVSQGDVNRTKTSKAYDEVRQIEELFKYYKQEDKQILTLAEISAIQNQQRSPLTSMLSRLKSLNNK